LDDYESPQPLICFLKPCKRNDAIRATVGLIDFSREMMNQGLIPIVMDGYFELPSEMRGSLGKDDFISKFKIPAECPYALEHLITKDNAHAHTFWNI
jgi:hypothetical protein